MQGEYSANSGVRPRLICADAQSPRDGDGDPQARLFLCAGCRSQVLICCFCDRGQIYCAAGCAGRARRRSLAAAGRRYQNSQPGRRAHAARTARWRARQNQARAKNVTHQGSPKPAAGDVVKPGSPADASDAIFSGDTPCVEAARCHWCARPCQGHVRQGFLRRRVRRRPHHRARRIFHHGSTA